MFKKLFMLNGNGAYANGSADTNSTAPELESLASAGDPQPDPPMDPPVEAPAPPKTAAFEQIYQSAGAKLPNTRFGILKVKEMAGSPYLAGMSLDAKRCALLMALEAAGVETEDVLQDAVARQRILNAYEEQQEERLKAFEEAKTDMNRAIQAELDRLTSQYLSRIQANLDDIARQQDKLRAWQIGKQEECQRITETAALLVPPQGTSNGVAGLSAVLERAAVSRR